MDLIGGVSFPAMLAALYGAYRLFVGNENVVVSIILVCGGLLTLLVIGPYVSVISSEGRRSWTGALAALGGLIPYLLSLFLMGYLGLYALWETVTRSFSIWVLLAALFWFLIGWRQLYVLGKLQRKLGRHPSYRQ
jgi:small-conductance mechanosensitive channel